jgi:hypothetical protein
MSLFTPLRRLLVAGAALATILAAPAQAQGDLLVAPTRVVINQGGSAEVVLSNIGSQPATYRISAELRRMDEEGDFAEIKEADANPAEKAALAMVTFAPRRITLLPGQPQSVRIAVRPPEGLADGEYRVHMNFRAIPAAQAPEEAPAAETGGLAIRLVPVYGITIPVFLRRGRLEGGASLANPRLLKTSYGTFVELDMNRTGQRSVYGALIGKNARGEVLFDLKGIAIYSEISHRKVQIPVPPEAQAKLTGPVKIEYRELPENGGALLAETSAVFQ